MNGAHSASLAFSIQRYGSTIVSPHSGSFTGSMRATGGRGGASAARVRSDGKSATNGVAAPAASRRRRVRDRMGTWPPRGGDGGAHYSGEERRYHRGTFRLLKPATHGHSRPDRACAVGC